MANCILPSDIMLNIQARLPVKSIIRFKSVCKPWLSLFSSPQFIKLHRSQFSSDTKNQTVIFYETNKYSMSLMNIQCGTEKKPTIIDCPHLENRRRDFVGCYNGLVCMVFQYSWPHQVVVIWNPAMKLFKSLWLKRPQTFSAIPLVSLGFGCDSSGDYKVVRVFYYEQIMFCDDADDDDEYMEDVAEVEVYSLNSNSYVTVSIDFQFDVSSLKNDVIVNGNPYWVAKVGGKEVLVYCDVTSLVCKIVPLPTFYVKGKVTLVDWKGALGALVCADDNERVLIKSLDVLVFDGVVNIWRKKQTFGPVEGINVDRYLYCLNNGSFIGEQSDGKLFVFDPDNGHVEEILIDVANMWDLQVHGYVESLARVQGMKGELEVEEVNDDDDRTRRFRAGLEGVFKSFPQLRVLNC